MRFSIRYSEIDSRGFLTVVALINYLQDCVTFASDKVGCTLDYLMEHSWGWFITSWEIYIERLPAYGEDIILDTWATKIKGVIANRDIIIYDSNGGVLVRARSLWVLMDLKKLSPIRIPDEVAEKYELKDPLPGIWGGRRIQIREGLISGTPAQVTEVLHLHLDTNGHMNNAYYIEIAREQIPEGKRICSMRTEYKRSAVLGDMMIVYAKSFGEITQVALTAEDGEIFALVEFGVL